MSMLALETQNSTWTRRKLHKAGRIYKTKKRPAWQIKLLIQLRWQQPQSSKQKENNCFDFSFDPRRQKGEIYRTNVDAMIKLSGNKSPWKKRKHKCVALLMQSILYMQVK